MTSRFGDWYDHTSDVIVWLGLLYVTMKQKQRPLTAPIVVLVMVALLLMMTSTGCQQRNLKTERRPETIDFTRPLCHRPHWIRWTRFFSPATFNGIMYILHPRGCRMHTDGRGGMVVFTPGKK